MKPWTRKETINAELIKCVHEFDPIASTVTVVLENGEEFKNVDAHMFWQLDLQEGEEQEVADTYFTEDETGKRNVIAQTLLEFFYNAE